VNRGVVEGAARWGGAIAFLAVLCFVLYLGAVGSVYLLAVILDALGAT
jgi:hypothetical protein